MNIHVACKNLNIENENKDDILETTLIKQYRKMSLFYHPDKNNSADAIQKFQEIHDSYEYLGKYLGYIDEDYYSDEYENKNVSKQSSWNFVAYKDVLFFLDITLGDDIIKQIKDRLFGKLVLGIDKRFNKYLNHEKLVKILDFLSQNKIKYDISDELLLHIESIINHIELIRAANVEKY